MIQEKGVSDGVVVDSWMTIQAVPRRGEVSERNERSSVVYNAKRGYRGEPS